MIAIVFVFIYQISKICMNPCNPLYISLSVSLTTINCQNVVYFELLLKVVDALPEVSQVHPAGLLCFV